MIPPSFYGIISISNTLLPKYPIKEWCIMYTIIPLLLSQIQVLNNQIKYLLFFIAKNIPLKSKPSDWNSPKYNKLKIDKLPIIKVNPVPQSENFKDLLKIYFLKFGKHLKPVAHRGKNTVPSHINCPSCNAPSDYIYDNTGGRGQFECKVCNNHFNEHTFSFKPIIFLCPHCGKQLELKKHRKNFNIHKCSNPDCSYFKSSLNSLSHNDLLVYQDNPHKFKLHYIYREFTTDFFKLDLFSLPKSASSFAFRKFSPHIMGLCLTYHVNCGLSTRKTSTILREVHGVKISHTQIASY